MFAPSNWLPRILLDDAESEEEKQELELLRAKYSLDDIGDWGARRPVAISNRLFALGQAFFDLLCSARGREVIVDAGFAPVD
jgi:hypothetical protein